MPDVMSDSYWMVLFQYCRHIADALLRSGKRMAVSNFFKCSNLTLVAKDIIAVIYDTGELGLDFLLVSDDLLNGFSKCITFNPLRFIICTYNWIKMSISDIVRFFHNLNTFTKKVSANIEDIKVQINYCKTHGEKELHLQTVAALEYIQKCSRNMS